MDKTDVAERDPDAVGTASRRETESSAVPGAPGTTLVLDAADVRELLDLDGCIDAVERALALHARGETPEPAVASVPVAGGGFHVKAAAARLGRFYFVAKTNGNFPGNPARTGLPTIQGVIVLADATDGRPLALLDSAEVTTLRTGAATGVAARHLARPDSAVATVVGCGVQGRVQLRALAATLRLERAFTVDVDAAAALRFATEMAEHLGIPVTALESVSEAARESDVIVTCTPSHEPLLGAEDVRPGTLVVAVGADHPEKHEIDPALFGRAAIVVDSLEQCASLGDLHHAIATGVVRATDVRGSLGEVVIGAAPGRSGAEEIVLFDSTGLALQDVAAAAIVYERAVRAGRGHAVALAG